MTILPRATASTALLIDADNVSTELVLQVLERLAAAGHLLQHRRAYGSVQKAAEFGEFCKDHAIRFLPSTFAGPNATDIALAIDAVELVLRQPTEHVVLVSSDTDFAPLIVRLRELGCRVTGYGQLGKSASNVERDYERVYDAFTVLDASGGSKKPATRRGTAKAAPRRTPERSAERVEERAPPPAVPREPEARPVAKKAKRAPRKSARGVAAEAPPAIELPKEVQAVLDACPSLRAGQIVQLNGVAKALRDGALLKKTGKTTSLFKKLGDHFELLPKDKPESVRFLGA